MIEFIVLRYQVSVVQLNASSHACMRPARALRGITANSATPSWKIWNVRESEPHPSFAARACIFWYFAFALCSISRVVGRLRGNFLLVEWSIPTTRTAGGLHYLSRSAALHAFFTVLLYVACSTGCLIVYSALYFFVGWPT